MVQAQARGNRHSRFGTAWCMAPASGAFMDAAATCETKPDRGPGWRHSTSAAARILTTTAQATNPEAHKSRQLAAATQLRVAACWCLLLAACLALFFVCQPRGYRPDMDDQRSLSLSPGLPLSLPPSLSLATVAIRTHTRRNSSARRRARVHGGGQCCCCVPPSRRPVSPAAADSAARLRSPQKPELRVLGPTLRCYAATTLPVQRQPAAHHGGTRGGAGGAHARSKHQ